jgi:hypothetical protein
MRADGTIVKIHTMVPFDTSSYPSVEPAQYALEVPAGTFADLGISEGDTAIIPPYEPFTVAHRSLLRVPQAPGKRPDAIIIGAISHRR